MAIKTTRWSPDTCGCVLEYQWDTEQSEATREHTFSKFVTRCSRHQSLSGTGLFNKVNAENKGKNGLYAEMLNTLTDITETVVENGEQVKKFKAGKEPQFKYQDDGKLYITTASLEVPGKLISASQKLKQESGIDVVIN